MDEYSLLPQGIHYTVPSIGIVNSDARIIATYTAADIVALQAERDALAAALRDTIENCFLCDGAGNREIHGRPIPCSACATARAALDTAGQEACNG